MIATDTPWTAPCDSKCWCCGNVGDWRNPDAPDIVWCMACKFADPDCKGPCNS